MQVCISQRWIGLSLGFAFQVRVRQAKDLMVLVDSYMLWQIHLHSHQFVVLRLHRSFAL